MLGDKQGMERQNKGGKEDFGDSTWNCVFQQV
jgi:hypothetical protein